MYRTSTPKHVFYFEFDAEKTLKNIQITYVQNGEIILTKTKDDLTFELKERSCGNLYAASFSLTQEETKRFGTSPFVSVQVRMLDTNDHVITSPTIRMRVEKVLNDEVLK